MPTAAEVQELGAALVKAIKSQRSITNWPIRLELMGLKQELVGFSPENEEIFRINAAAGWL